MINCIECGNVLSVDVYSDFSCPNCWTKYCGIEYREETLDEQESLVKLAWDDFMKHTDIPLDDTVWLDETWSNFLDALCTEETISRYIYDTVERPE